MEAPEALISIILGCTLILAFGGLVSYFASAPTTGSTIASYNSSFVTTASNALGQTVANYSSGNVQDDLQNTTGSTETQSYYGSLNVGSAYSVLMNIFTLPAIAISLFTDFVSVIFGTFGLSGQGILLMAVSSIILVTVIWWVLASVIKWNVGR